MATEISFPNVEPVYVFERDSLSFRALADGKPIECLISAELLFQQFGAREFSEPELREAFDRHKEEIQALARSHIQSGWISKDNRIILTTRVTRLQVTYGDELRKRPRDFQLAQEAMRILSEAIGPGSGEVHVDMESEEHEGQPLLRISISDANGRAADRFDARASNQGGSLRVRMARLWGDFLQIRSQQLLQRLG